MDSQRVAALVTVREEPRYRAPHHRDIDVALREIALDDVGGMLGRIPALLRVEARLIDEPVLQQPVRRRRAREKRRSAASSAFQAAVPADRPGACRFRYSLFPGTTSA